MTVRFECGNGAALLEYVYDECSPQDSPVVAAHVATCERCAEEVRALQTTREEMRAWTPPDAVLGFRMPGVVSLPAEILRPTRWWRRPLPAWAQVAAAVVLFAAGVGLGALRGTGAESSAPLVAVTPADVDSATIPVSARDLTALEQRLRADMSARDRGAAPAVSPRQSDDALLQQVRVMIRESERRQQQELALRTAELVKDVDAQRRGDLARIERTFGQMEGTTGVQVEQQRQLLNYLMRVSQRQPQ